MLQTHGPSAPWAQDSGGVAIPRGATVAPRLRLAASGARPKAWVQGPMGPGPWALEPLGQGGAAPMGPGPWALGP